MTPRLKHSSDNDATGAVPTPVVETPSAVRSPSAPGEETMEFTLPTPPRARLLSVLSLLGGFGVAAVSLADRADDPPQEYVSQNELARRIEADQQRALSSMGAAIEKEGADCVTTADRMSCSSQDGAHHVDIAFTDGYNLSVHMDGNTPRYAEGFPDMRTSVTRAAIIHLKGEDL